MKQLLFIAILILNIVPTLARDFEYTYKGQTMTYTVIDEDAKTCMTKEGKSTSYTPGNYISGDLILPEYPMDGDVQFTLTSISSYAFYLCYDLTSIVIPNTVTGIYNNAFDGCRNLVSFEIPNSVTFLGEYAFRSCENLLSVNLPNTISSIRSGTFSYCYKLKSISLPETLTSIGNSAFYCCYGLQSITLPESIKSIEAGAFSGCNNLMSIVNNATTPIICHEGVFPELVYWYGNLNMPNSSYSDIQSKAPWNLFKHVTTSQDTYVFLDDGDFEYDGIIYSIIDGDLHTCATRRGNKNTPGNLYEGDLIIPSIVSDGTKEYTVTEIGFWGFSGCDITSVFLNEPLNKLGTECFKNCINLSSAHLPESLNMIINEAFSGCENLNIVNLPESLTEIGTSAFDSCNSLSSITLPASLKKLGLSVFAGCNNLETITYNASIPIKASGRMFSPCTFQTATLVMSDAALEDILNTYPWNEFRRIQSKDENYIKHLAAGEDFEFEGVKYTVIDPIAHTCKTKDGLSEIDPGNSYEGDLIIPQVISDGVDYNTVIAIGEYGFSNSSRDLKSVVLPETITSIGHNAFKYCTSLETVYLPQSLSVIEDHVFYYCAKLKSINFPESMISIGNDAFSYCSKLCSISLPNSLKYIGDRAFVGCGNISEISFSESLNTIGDNAFSGCSSLTLKADELPESLTYIGREAFSNCKSLTSITLPSSITTIMPSAFEGCTGLTTVRIKALISKIEEKMFYGCENLTDVSLPESLSSIGEASFRNCTSLNFITLSQNVHEIESHAFNGCCNLVSINFPEAISSIGDNAFWGCSSLASVTFPEALTSLGKHAFRDCSSLTEISIPESLTEIPMSAFEGCSGLLSISLPESLTKIDDYAFEGCSSMKSINLPKSLTYIGNYVFSNCSVMRHIIIPNSVSSMGFFVFYSCNNLEEVTLPESLTNISNDTFYGCDNLYYIYSLAQNPPVCYSANIYKNDKTIVYVPKGSLEAYKGAVYWKEFSNILEMGSLIVSLSERELNLVPGDSKSIYADITKDDNVSIRSKVWSSSDVNVATVEDGLITAVGEGETTICLDITDRYGRIFSEKCLITVKPRVLVDGIVIKSDVTSLKKKRSLILSVEISPTNATEKSIVWSSSDDNIATIDEMGMIRAIATGNVTFTASAVDGSGITASFVISVLPPTKGDSNDDDNLLIDDAVRTANFAIGNEVTEFCFEAADVNEDGVITIGDASGTITEILNQQVQSSAKSTMNISSNQSISTDFLAIDDFNYIPGKPSIVDITLDNSTQYVALQADIFAPKDMKILDVEAGPRAKNNHSLIYRLIDENTARIILFDPNNSAFADNDSPLLRLTLESEYAFDGDIIISNIHASDIYANEYKLLSEGCRYSSISGVDASHIDPTIKIESRLGAVYISNAEGQEISIYNLDGVCIDRFIADNNIMSINLSNGVYIVKAGIATSKIIIK